MSKSYNFKEKTIKKKLKNINFTSIFENQIERGSCKNIENRPKIEKVMVLRVKAQFYYSKINL